MTDQDKELRRKIVHEIRRAILDYPTDDAMPFSARVKERAIIIGRATDAILAFLPPPSPDRWRDTPEVEALKAAAVRWHKAIRTVEGQSATEEQVNEMLNADFMKDEAARAYASTLPSQTQEEKS